MKRTAPLTAAHAAYGSRLRHRMEEVGMTRHVLAGRLGVTDTMVGYWRVGRHLPTLILAEAIADELNDAVLKNMVVTARTRRCPCGQTFDREQTRRLYCTPRCQRRAHYKNGRKADVKQDAIDAMCRGCEPEGTCRDDSCALRPFSPFLFVPLHRIVA